MLNSILCALCQITEETCQHIFLECPFAQSVWTLCFKWLGVLFVQHNVLSMHYENFCLPQVSNNQNLLWKGVWATIVRCIWENRNSIMLNQSVADLEEVFLMAQLKSWQWLKYKGQPFIYSLANWVLNPLICCKTRT